MNIIKLFFTIAGFMVVMFQNSVLTSADEYFEGNQWEKATLSPNDNFGNGDFAKIPELTAYEQYKDLFVLTSKNFTSRIFQKPEPWIVIFHDNGQLITGWKTMASSLRGIVWVGVINKAEEMHLLKKLDIDPKTAPSAYVYPHGSKRFKETHFTSVFTPLEAKNKAVQSIPDHFQKVQGSDIEGLLMDSFTASPSRFPALMIMQEAIIPPVFKALAARFKKYFNFGVMIDPSSSDLSTLGLQNYYFDFPSFFIMVTSNPIEPKVNAVMYNVEEMGEINYPNLMKFLFYVNEEFRFQLPGENMSNMETEAKMLDIREIEEERFDFVDSMTENKSTVKKIKTEL